MYEDILADFGWRESADAASAHALHARLTGHDAFRDVGTELKHRPRVIVVGCGPTLDSVKASNLPEGIVVAADGATSRLREIGVLPRVVVSDLDGDVDDLAWAAQQGASFVVHAHGDNQDRLQAIEHLGPFVAGTYQSTADPALLPMRNIGGLTDGDRAVSLCERFRVKEVMLACFDFDAPPSRYSHHWDPDTKGRKLAWARRIIEGVHARGQTRVALLD